MKLHRSRKNPGFSLVELLVCIAIIGLLGGLANAGYQRAVSASRQGAEVTAARNLGLALQLYAQENEGAVLPGYLDARDPRLAGIRNNKGEPLSPSHAAQRYTWRLLPYMNYQIRGGTWVNKLASQIPSSEPFYDYYVSLVPSLGMNTTYVGGDARNTQPSGRCVTRLNRASSPSTLIAFASAGGYEDPKYGKLDGYFEVRPPMGGSSDEAGLSMRFNGKAVAVMLDGHVELLDQGQLKDMRRWCDEAAVRNNPNWTP